MIKVNELKISYFLFLISYFLLGGAGLLFLSCLYSCCICWAGTATTIIFRYFFFSRLPSVGIIYICDLSNGVSRYPRITFQNVAVY